MYSLGGKTKNNSICSSGRVAELYEFIMQCLHSESQCSDALKCRCSETMDIRICDKAKCTLPLAFSRIEFAL